MVIREIEVDKSDDSYTYVDCYDRFYRYKNTEKPYEFHGEHHQIQTGGWIVETWYGSLRMWIKFENISLEEDVLDLMKLLKRNADRRKSLAETQL